MASILIVDDDAMIRDTLYDLLSTEHLCCAAASAEEALVLLRKDAYDLVLTDISLPGLSGLELLGHVLQSYESTRVIVISGISDEEHARGLMRLGAFDYLLKPFRLDVVEDSVKRAIASGSGSGEADQRTLGQEETDASDLHIEKDGSGL
jgi:DNA-binding NtrC family response regulator